MLHYQPEQPHTCVLNICCPPALRSPSHVRTGEPLLAISAGLVVPTAWFRELEVNPPSRKQAAPSASLPIVDGPRYPARGPPSEPNTVSSNRSYRFDVLAQLRDSR